MTFVQSDIEHFSSWIYLMGSFSTWLVQSRIKAKKNSTDNPCRRFYFTISITICFADIPSFDSKLNETFWSIIGWFDPLEKQAKQPVPKFPSRRFYYLYRSQYSDLFWYSVHFLVRSIGLFFDDILLTEQRWNANLAQSRLRFWKPSHTYRRECARQVCLITKLVLHSCCQF